MNVLSLFSGAGGMDLGLEQAGHTIVAMCEIDKSAREVLHRHWKQTPIYEDVTSLDGTQFKGTIDLVAGGSPCQNLSVAGKREGLGGTASSLFWHQCRIADQAAAPWVLWENVPGALTSNSGADFAAVLWGLTGALPDLPDGGKWLTSGMVVGPKRTAIWRLFDAQYFGVAQRRRRVFVIAGPRTLCTPEIFFECESVFRDNQPIRTERETASAEIESSVTDEDRYATYWDGGQLSDTIDVSMAVKGQMMPEKRRMFAVIEPYVKKTRAQSKEDYESWLEGTVNPTLSVFDMGETRATTVIAETEYGSNWQNGGGYGNANDGLGITENGVGPLSRSQILATTSPGGARRLTPLEAERLMGWPDGWTEFAADGTRISDSQRYKMCGNGVVAPITKWIGQRLP
jgi:DNA (cytosine-5)-methyltransferase 1